MDRMSILPLLISEDEDLAQWLCEVSASTPLFEFVPVQTVTLGAEPDLSGTDQHVVLFVDITDIHEDEAIKEQVEAARTKFSPLPIIVLAAETEVGLRALEFGALDYLVLAETDGNLLARAVRYVLTARPSASERDKAQHEEPFQRFLENAPDIIYIFDLTSHHVTYFNREQLLGYSAEELHKPDSILPLVHPSDQAAVKQHWEQLSQAALGDVFVTEYRLKHKQGNWEWVQSRETILTVNDKGIATQILVSLSIITQRKQRESAVRRYAERLQILHEIDQAIVAARSPQAIAQAALRRISRLIPSRRASVVVFNWEEETFTVMAELPEGASGSNGSSSLPLSWFWPVETLEQGEIYREPDLGAMLSENRTPLTEWLENQGLRAFISVPLQGQRQLIGALNFGTDEADGFSSEDVIVMREVAHVLAIAMGQARLYEQVHYHARKLEQRAKRLVLVNDISLAVNRPVELSAVLEAAAKGLVAVIDIKQVGIALLNEARDTWTLMASYSARAGRTLENIAVLVRDKDVVQQLWQAEPFLVIENAQDDPRLGDLHHVLVERDVSNLILVPLQGREEIIGVIGCDIGPAERLFSREETELIQTIANLLSIKIEQIRLLEAERLARSQAEDHAANLRLREHHLTVLNAITRATTGLEMQEMLQTVISRLGELSGADACYITLWNKERQIPELTAAYGPYEASYTAYDVETEERTLTGLTLEAGHSLVVNSNTPSAAVASLPLNGNTANSTLAVPLEAGKEKLGALIVTFEQSYDFSSEEVNLYEQAAGQIALALSAARLFDETRRQLEELKVLHTLATAGAEAESEDALLERATLLMEETFFPDNFGVLLYDETTQVLYAHHSYRSGRYEKKNVNIPLSSGVCGYVAKTGQPLRIPDVSLNPHYVAADPETRSELCVPLKTGDRLLGVVNAESTRVASFSPLHERLLITFAHQLATAIEKLRLLQVERRRRREAETVSEILRALNATPNVREAFYHVATSVRAITNCSCVSLALANEERTAFTIFALEPPLPKQLADVWYPIESTAAAEDVLAGRVHLSADLSKEPGGTFEQLLLKAGQHSRMSLPLRAGGIIVGSLNLTWEAKEAYDENQLPLLSQIASAVALAVERGRLFAETQTNLAETQALYQLGRSLIAAENLPTLLQTLVNDVAQALPADRIRLVTVDMQTHKIIDDVSDNLGELAFPLLTPEALWSGLTGWVLREQEPLLLSKEEPDARESEAMRVWREEARVGSMIIVPLRYRDKMLGTISAINSREKPDFTERSMDLMVAMANQAAVAIENARLFAETHRRAEELEVLADLSTALRVADGAVEIMKIVLASSMELFAAEMAAIAVPSVEPEQLIIAHQINVPPALLEHSYHLEDSIFGHVFSTGKPYRTVSVLEDPLIHDLSKGTWIAQDVYPKAAIYAPLQAGSDVIGIICIMTTSTHVFEDEDLRLLTAMAEIAGSALQRAGLMETLEQRVEERTRELAEANEQLKELDRLKSKFVSDISHELRTPITNLSLYMDLLERGSPDRTERYWAVLRKQTERLNQLIEDILSLSRLQLGKVDITFVPVDLNDLVAEVLNVHRERFEAAGLDLQFAPDEALTPILGQPEQLVRMVANLLSNALNYTREGWVCVSTVLDEVEEVVCLSIEDTGVGIDEDDLNHVFERFYRGEYAGQSSIPGTGLGLTIVEEIVNLHQGRIEVESQKDVGTIFRVWLPLSAEPNNGQ